LIQGPCLGTKIKSCMQKKEIWFPHTSTDGSQGNNELSSMIMTLTMVEYRKEGTSYRKIYPLAFCFGKQQSTASEVIVRWPYLLITNEHICMNLCFAFEPIYIVFSNMYNIAHPLWSLISPILSAKMPNFDQNGIQ